MKQFIFAMALLTSASSLGSVESECGIALGLAVSAESMTAYGTTDHFYTNPEHAGAVYGTKMRQIDKLVESIQELAVNLPEKGAAIAREASLLKAGVHRVFVADTTVYNNGIDSADTSLTSFSRAMRNLCQ